MFSITERQYGCVGEPQYLSGTSARPRHRLLLRHAFPGGELAAGKLQCHAVGGVRAYPTSLEFRVVRSECGCQLYLFRPEVRVQFRGEMGTLVLSITHVRNLPEWMGWRRRVIKLSNAICKDEELDLIIGTEFSLE